MGVTSPIKNNNANKTINFQQKVIKLLRKSFSFQKKNITQAKGPSTQ